MTFDEMRRGSGLASKHSHRPLAPSSSTSCASPTWSEPSGSASSGVTPRRVPFGELLIDLEEDKTAQAVVFGLLGRDTL
jgi:hypothetical protein